MYGSCRGVSHPQTGHSQRQQFSTCRDSFVVMSSSWSGWDPWAASVFLGQEKEREANGVETRSKLGCHREWGPPCCVTPSPGEGVVGNELLVGSRAGGDAALGGGAGNSTEPRDRIHQHKPAAGLLARPGTVAWWKRRRREVQREGLGKAQRRTRSTGRCLLGSRVCLGRGWAAEVWAGEQELRAGLGCHSSVCGLTPPHTHGGRTRLPTLQHPPVVPGLCCPRGGQDRQTGRGVCLGHPWEPRGGCGQRWVLGSTLGSAAAVCRRELRR